ncbi:hypothetical protein [Natrinema salaciae]|uniref:Uncharacterized protein n=1 Tax=Natrinema salaciae TaxID=1186196 RepID=A0A1H9H3Z6_9EURY|nr:hypothetical protein [Natrinema salaciae]SEQ56967.1 hypothetical protein SAMN04489841_2085 [Natrinema salaciae]
MTDDDRDSLESRGDGAAADAPDGEATDASAAESDGTDSEAIGVDRVDLEAGTPADELYFPPCPHCGQRMLTITSRGPRDHGAGPCGCRLTREDVRQL